MNNDAQDARRYHLLVSTVIADMNEQPLTPDQQAAKDVFPLSDNFTLEAVNQALDSVLLRFPPPAPPPRRNPNCLLKHCPYDAVCIRLGCRL